MPGVAEPALVSFSLANDGGCTASFLEADHYAIHVLDAAQADTCWAFLLNHAFDQSTDADGVPVGTMHSPSSARAATYPGGDHTIVLAEIKRYTWRDGDAPGFRRSTHRVSSHPA